MTQQEIITQTKRKKHGSLFSGIGGFDLAAEWMGWENVFHCEWNEFRQKILKYYWPNAISYGDITKTDFTKHRGTIDIISAGPPCQPTSIAGKREGENDDRWLWPEAIRVLGEIRPAIAVFENPDDLLTLDNGKPFERICCSMENIGYKVETYGIPAACVGAWHERDRLWIIAYGEDTRQTKGNKGADFKEGQTLDGERIWIKPCPEIKVIPDTNSRDYRSQHANQSEAFLNRMNHSRGVNLVEHMQRLGHIGKLNPEWCEWFMGYPIGWTELNPLETQSSHK